MSNHLDQSAEQPNNSAVSKLNLTNQFDRMVARECLFGALSKALKANGGDVTMSAKLEGTFTSEPTMRGYELVVTGSELSENLKSVISRRSDDLTYELQFTIDPQTVMNIPEFECLQVIGKFLDTLRVPYSLTLGHSDLSEATNERWTSLVKLMSRRNLNNESQTESQTASSSEEFREHQALESVLLLGENCSSFGGIINYVLGAGSPNTTGIWFAVSLPHVSDVRVMFGHRTCKDHLGVSLFVEDLVDNCFADQRNLQIARSRFYDLVSLRFSRMYAVKQFENLEEQKKRLNQSKKNRSTEELFERIEKEIQNVAYRIKDIEKDIESRMDYWIEQ